MLAEIIILQHVLGFVLIFALLGALAAVLGSALREYQQWFARIAGLLLVLFGVALTGLVPVPLLSRDYHLEVKQGSSSWWRTGLIGLAWGIAFSVIVGLLAAVGIAGPDLIADLVLGLGFSLAVKQNVRKHFIARLEVSLVLALIFGVIASLTTGAFGGLASGLATGLGSMVGLWRGPASVGGTSSSEEPITEGVDLRESG